MRNDNKFTQDLSLFIKKVGKDLDKKSFKKLIHIQRKLTTLHSKGLVKINHSIMEVLCVKFLITEGYEVEVEKPLEGSLNCDIYSVKGDGVLIVEVETGFIPPDHALDPSIYSAARIASKIARYSIFADKFALGTPPYHLLNIPKIFVKPPRDRSLNEINEIKALCDIYYRNPPISLEELKNARLHTIYVIDVDGGIVREVDPDAYWDTVQSWNYKLKINNFKRD
ncbi:hypothetical protein KEJ50_05495 [Candidatus Bathyarchaeota archaeon]|nr:hypothetical protein [Candidatus Bathyarchaeota archaeon]